MREKGAQSCTKLEYIETKAKKLSRVSTLEYSRTGQPIGYFHCIQAPGDAGRKLLSSALVQRSHDLGS